MIDILIEDHNRIRKAADALRVLLSSANPPDPASLAKARWALGSLVMRHLSFEERHLYAQLENHRDGKLREMSQAFRNWLSREFASYVGHARQWTPQAVEKAWTKYRLDALHFLDLLAQRIREEEEELFPLIEQNGIDLGKVAPPVTNWAKDAFAIQGSISRKA